MNEFLIYEQMPGRYGYYYSLASTAIGEVKAVLHKGTTVSKREINYQFSDDITTLES